MAVSCDPTDLATAAKCYCYDAVTRQRVIIRLLAIIAGKAGVSPSDLAEEAACYCYDPVTAKKVEIALLCVAAGGTLP